MATPRKARTARKTADPVLTTVNLPPALHQRTKIASARLNLTMTEVIRAALKQWLAQSGRARGVRR